MQDIIVLIPARSGSKGIKDKNIKSLNNHPLLAYTIRAAQNVNLINRIIVSTDSEEYAEIARKYGGTAPFLRPSQFAGDESTDFEWIQHALEWMKKNEGFLPRLIVHLRPTTPLRDPIIIQKAIETIEANKEATALRSVHEMPFTAYKTCEVEGKYLTSSYTRSHELDKINFARQQYPITYQPNGYVDILKGDFVFENENKNIHGDKVLAHITPQIQDVDVPEDFSYLRYQLEHNKERFDKLVSLPDQKK
jgi:CMP-N,N'-diacetyllegionaminic acid synthase